MEMIWMIYCTETESCSGVKVCEATKPDGNLTLLRVSVKCTEGKRRNLLLKLREGKLRLPGAIPYREGELTRGNRRFPFMNHGSLTGNRTPITGMRILCPNR